MPISMESLPLDDNGLLSQPFRVRHQDPGFNEGFGEVWFKDGLSNLLEGEPLARIVAAIGDDLELVPVDDNGDPLEEPESFSDDPGLAENEAPDEDEADEDETTEPGHETNPGPAETVDPLDDTQPVPIPNEDGADEEPPATAEKPSKLAALEAGLPDDRDALRALATSRGVDIDLRWGVKKLRAAIVAAAAEAEC